MKHIIVCPLRYSHYYYHHGDSEGDVYGGKY